MAGNQKSFNLISRTTKSFNIILSFFDYAVTFIFRIKPKINLTFVMKAQTKWTQTIAVKRIVMTISKMALTMSQIQDFRIKPIRISGVLKGIVKFVINPKHKLDILFIMKAIQKVVTDLNFKRLRLGFTALLAKFFPLSDYDPDTLASMDTETLVDLDYTVA
jgi:hypothetical protein